MRARMEMASTTGGSAQTLYNLAASDLEGSLSRSLNELADVESKARESLRIQTERDFS